MRLWLLSNFVKEKESPHLRLRLSVDILQGALIPLGLFPYRPGSISFPKPVLFLRGLQSHYIPETAFPLMHSLFPQSKTVNIDCGHWIVQEKPEELRQGKSYPSCLDYMILINRETSCCSIPAERLIA